MVANIFFQFFLFKYMPFGSMNMLFILQILHFYFFPFLFYFFAPAAQFSCGSIAQAHSTFKNFNGLLKRVSIRFFRGITLVYMRRKKIGPKRLFFRQNAKKTPFLFCFSTEVNQTQTWSSYLYWAGQV